MEYAKIQLKVLDSAAFTEASRGAQACWLILHGWASRNETSGLVECANWRSKSWGKVGVTKSEARKCAEAGLLIPNNNGYSIVGYDQAGEDLYKARRARGAAGGRKSRRAKDSDKHALNRSVDRQLNRAPQAPASPHAQAQAVTQLSTPPKPAKPPREREAQGSTGSMFANLGQDLVDAYPHPPGRKAHAMQAEKFIGGMVAVGEISPADYPEILAGAKRYAEYQAKWSKKAPQDLKWWLHERNWLTDWSEPISAEAKKEKDMIAKLFADAEAKAAAGNGAR